jgi:Flp pilus assembly protein TadB
MAVTFTSTFAIGALGAGDSSGGEAPFAAAAMGLLLVVAAVAVLVRGRRTVARLTRRRETLERELEAVVRRQLNDGTPTVM